MNKISILIFLFLSQTIYCQDFQLSIPVTSQTRIILDNKPVKIGLSFRLDSAIIRYTIDGSDVTINSRIYTDSIIVKKPYTIKAASFHADFKTSDPITIHVIDQKSTFYDIEVNKANEKYLGNGAKTLHDKKLGGLRFDQDYLGYDGQEILISTKLTKKAKINFVTVSALTNQPSWIFGPSEVIVYDVKGNVIGQGQYPENIIEKQTKPTLYKIRCDGKKHKDIKVVIKPVVSIPDWHDGKGNPAWLFIDEIWFE